VDVGDEINGKVNASVGVAAKRKSAVMTESGKEEDGVMMMT
jgi:hypothetical protein